VYVAVGLVYGWEEISKDFFTRIPFSSSLAC
jgi:hypothetical protein